MAATIRWCSSDLELVLSPDCRASMPLHSAASAVYRHWPSSARRIRSAVASRSCSLAPEQEGSWGATGSAAPPGNLSTRNFRCCSATLRTPLPPPASPNSTPWLTAVCPCAIATPHTTTHHESVTVAHVPDLTTTSVLPVL